MRRPLYEGVDWNNASELIQYNTLCRPLYEGVDWNMKQKWTIRFVIVALFTRAWIEMLSLIAKILINAVALFTRAWIEIAVILMLIALCSGRPLYEGVDWNWFTGYINVFTSWSPSLRGRGLKYLPHYLFCFLRPVALFTRAWIEMLISVGIGAFARLSPSLRGRGLKY